MARYQVAIKPSANKELDKLPNAVIARIVPRLEELEAEEAMTDEAMKTPLSYPRVAAVSAPMAPLLPDAPCA